MLRKKPADITYSWTQQDPVEAALCAALAELADAYKAHCAQFPPDPEYTTAYGKAVMGVSAELRAIRKQAVGV